MVAPETAACLIYLLMDSDAHYSSIIDGYHTEPEVLKDAFNAANKQSTLMKTPELRRRIVAALAHYYRLIQTPDGNRVVARMIAHQHLAQLGLHPQLWSLSRGLARRQEEYHAVLDMTGRTVEGQLAGDVLRSNKAFLSFIEFMLDVCHEEVDYMIAALSRSKLRESVMQVFSTLPQLTDAGVKPEIAPAYLALLIQGALPCSEFKTFTGLLPDIANDQLNRLIDVGVVVSSPSDPLTISVALPNWFVRELLPDLLKSW
jgi:hypothetical protein